MFFLHCLLQFIIMQNNKNTLKHYLVWEKQFKKEHKAIKMNVVQLKLFDPGWIWWEIFEFIEIWLLIAGWEFNQSCVSDFFQCQGNTNSLPVGMSGPGPSNGSNNGNALASMRGHSFSLMTISYISSVSHPHLHNKLCRTWRGEKKKWSRFLRVWYQPSFTRLPFPTSPPYLS